MANPTGVRKSFTHGEIGLAIALSVLALFSLIVAGKAHSSAYSFHAILFAAVSAYPEIDDDIEVDLNPAE